MQPDGSYVGGQPFLRPWRLPLAGRFGGKAIFAAIFFYCFCDAVRLGALPPRSGKRVTEACGAALILHFGLPRSPFDKAKGLYALHRPADGARAASRLAVTSRWTPAKAVCAAVPRRRSRIRGVSAVVVDSRKVQEKTYVFIMDECMDRYF